ncbi:RidA family protein [Cupriavidus pinatubonensis]|uniref:RidA family protein n=1 Tax=Cupriavidus pinatubonensis TaxID=248026 RepID=UPI001C73C0FB|nr:RidA family protein [Cupriavidus pinatubonensis]QYY29552.1 RidA family protein [Cupriavidus pinatubonensis]
MISPAPFKERHYDQLHFSSATRVGDMIWVSGQVGLDVATGKPGEGMAEQARLAFNNLKCVLEEAGATMADIVEIVTFHIDLHGPDIQAFVRAKDEFLPERYPSWTAVGVTQLANPAFLVEVRAVAVAGCGAD